MPQIACIVNPVGRQSDRAWQLVLQHCAALGYATPQRLETTIDHPGDRQARQALEAGADSIIVVGGDGTIRNVSNEMAHTPVPIGIVPTGTANIFHLNVVGKSRSLDRSVRTAILGTPVSVDLGRVALSFTDDRPDWESSFLVVVGIGHDAEALANVSLSLKRRIGPAAYFVAGARQLLGRQFDLDIDIDDQPLPRQRVWSLLVGNCGRVPGGITIFPDANVQDGLLNVLRLTPSSLASWAPIAWRSWRGRSGGPGSTPEVTASAVTVKSEIAFPVQIDGDVWPGVGSVQIGIDPSALRIRSGSKA